MCLFSTWIYILYFDMLKISLPKFTIIENRGSLFHISVKTDSHEPPSSSDRRLPTSGPYSDL